MKRSILITIMFVSITNFLFAQWTTSGTNVYNSNTGNVGIGTINPTATLSVKGSALPTGQWSGYTSSLQVGQLLIQDYNVVPQVGIGQNTYYDGTGNKYILNGYASGMYMGAHGNITFSVFNSGTSGNAVSGTGVAMTLANNGNVGIGTTAPDAKLAVNGTIHSKSVLIDLKGWPDYVFEKGYKLPTLESVKAYIQQHQHLPEIPSQAEMVKSGLDVSEANKLFLKKMEEMTLYMIEAKEEIMTLKKEVRQLKNKLNKR